MDLQKTHGQIRRDARRRPGRRGNRQVIELRPPHHPPTADEPIHRQRRSTRPDHQVDEQDVHHGVHAEDAGRRALDLETQFVDRVVLPGELVHWPGHRGRRQAAGRRGHELGRVGGHRDAHRAGVGGIDGADEGAQAVVERGLRRHGGVGEGDGVAVDREDRHGSERLHAGALEAEALLVVGLVDPGQLDLGPGGRLGGET